MSLRRVACATSQGSKVFQAVAVYRRNSAALASRNKPRPPRELPLNREMGSRGCMLGKGVLCCVRHGVVALGPLKLFRTVAPPLLAARQPLCRGCPNMFLDHAWRDPGQDLRSAGRTGIETAFSTDRQGAGTVCTHHQGSTDPLRDGYALQTGC